MGRAAVEVLHAHLRWALGTDQQLWAAAAVGSAGLLARAVKCLRYLRTKGEIDGVIRRDEVKVRMVSFALQEGSRIEFLAPVRPLGSPSSEEEEFEPETFEEFYALLERTMTGDQASYLPTESAAREIWHQLRAQRGDWQGGET